MYWVYLGGATLVTAGFADYPLIAYHFSKSRILAGQWIAIFYSVAMAVSGTGPVLFGRLFDRYGFKVLIVLTVVSTTFAARVWVSRHHDHVAASR